MSGRVGRINRTSLVLVLIAQPRPSLLSMSVFLTIHHGPGSLTYISFLHLHILLHYPKVQLFRNLAAS